MFFLNTITAIVDLRLAASKKANGFMYVFQLFQCKCCESPSQEMILPTFPDLSIVYKLHLECGKLINLYDWLQAFLTIVDPIECSDNDDEERREIHPEIQYPLKRNLYLIFKLH